MFLHGVYLDLLSCGKEMIIHNSNVLIEREEMYATSVWGHACWCAIREFAFW